MVIWGAVVALVASLLVLGPLAESAPAWAGEAALLLMALSAFVLVCMGEAGWRASQNSERADQGTD